MKKIIAVLFLFALIWSCTDKFDINDVDAGNLNVNLGDTLFIQQFPVWQGFNKPEAMIVGREPFLYVCDTENDRIVMLDISGKVVGERAVKHPVAIAQDYRLNLIVCASFDTTINLSGSEEQVTYSAVYKLDMFGAGNQIEQAEMKRLLPTSSKDFSNPERMFTGAAVFFDNSFIIGRSGPTNTSPVDPDNSILKFEQVTRNGVEKDTLVGRVPNIAYDGTGLVSANGITSLTTFNRKNTDFLITLGGENNFKTQWLTYLETMTESKYISSLYPGEADIMDVNLFGKPEGTALDESENIYVADAEKDSIYKFNSFGDLMQAFGGNTGFPDLPLDEPHDVAFFDKTLYVVDTNNDRILRFILSTELD